MTKVIQYMSMSSVNDEQYAYCAFWVNKTNSDLSFGK